MKTKNKILLARLCNLIVNNFRICLNKKNPFQARRKGINWELDINEGIDFSIYLLGGFEIRTLNLYKKIILPGHVVFDIGANIGSHTLPIAKIVGAEGKVIAVEPTYFAFKKLKRNISLNPTIKDRIIPIQAFLSDSKNKNLPQAIYSSWPLKNDKKLHAIHNGKLKKTNGAYVGTFDELFKKLNLHHINFMKVDIDGKETELFFGAKETLRKFKPKILCEWAPYLQEERGKGEKFLGLLKDLGYQCKDGFNDLLSNKKNKTLAGSKNILFY